MKKDRRFLLYKAFNQFLNHIKINKIKKKKIHY